MKLRILLLIMFGVSSTYGAYSQTPVSYSGTSDAEADAIINLLGVQKKRSCE